MSTNPHEPAFPADSRESATFKGMTKREKFAEAAMQGLCANADYMKAVSALVAEGKVANTEQAIAISSKACADALIAELNNKEPFGGSSPCANEKPNVSGATHGIKEAIMYEEEGKYPVPCANCGSPVQPGGFDLCRSCLESRRRWDQYLASQPIASQLHGHTCDCDGCVHDGMVEAR